MRTNPWLRSVSGVSALVHFAIALYMFTVLVRPGVPVDAILYGIIPPKVWGMLLLESTILMIAGTLKYPRLIRAGFGVASFFWFCMTVSYVIVAVTTRTPSATLGAILIGYICALHVAKGFVPLYVLGSPDDS